MFSYDGKFENALIALNVIVIIKVLILITGGPKIIKLNDIYKFFNYIELLFAIIMLIVYFSVKRKINNFYKEEKDLYKRETKHRKIFFHISLIPYYIELILVILNKLKIINIFL